MTLALVKIAMCIGDHIVVFLNISLYSYCMKINLSLTLAEIIRKYAYAGLRFYRRKTDFAGV